MKKNYKNKFLGLSLVTAALLGSSAYAGKIIGVTAGTPYNETVPPTQYGFGGWNFDNVNVKIVDDETFDVDMGEFNTTTGEYSVMDETMSFESDIYNIVEYNATSGNTIGSTVMGQLHGKDWPVGEPAGIKIVNDDYKTNNGKPENCIMTTSYLDANATGNGEPSGYLDTTALAGPVPTICSSPFQTHKRFKINMMPTTFEGITIDPVNGAYGKPIEIVFNLAVDDNTTVRRYQVLQKINNYTGMRLNGYTIEVLDENGTKNNALTLSLGEGEGVDENGTLDGSNIWDSEDMANFSHGLWGPYEAHKGVVRFDNGFFDFKRTYYPVALSDNNHTISYVGDLQGGNYQSIFGNWLPSEWAPYGVFHDDDQDPSTDAALMAFYGTAPGYSEDAWYKRTVVYDPTTPNVDPVYTWLPATNEDFATWSGEWYSVGIVEDVLNLGLNYIVNVGENAKIGKTFTIRITPHVGANDQVPPSYVGTVPTIPTDPTVPTVPTDPIISSGGGGGCTYNPNSKNFDMSFLFMMALGLLYPIRRRFIK